MDCSFFVTCKLASEKEILPNGMELILTLHIHPLPRPLPHVPYTPLDRILRTWPKTLRSLEHSFPLTSSEGLNKFHSLTFLCVKWRYNSHNTISDSEMKQLRCLINIKIRLQDSNSRQSSWSSLL